MGTVFSYLFGEGPWRYSTIEWNSTFRNELKSNLVKFEPHSSMNNSCYNILLVSPVGSGKTSFCNTVQSTFAGCITKYGITGKSGTSITKKYEIHKVFTKEEKRLKFNLCDTRGLEKNFQYSEESFKKMINGNLAKGQEITDNNQLYGGNVANEDTKIHCVCFVFSPETLKLLEKETFEIFVKYQRILNTHGIHTGILLTHIDTNDDTKILSGADVKHVFHSKKVEEFVKQASQKFGIDENQIFPIKNYHNETEPILEMDILTLYTLTSILNMCEGRMKHADQMQN